LIDLSSPYLLICIQRKGAELAENTWRGLWL
jgi:hypothetical protein